MVNKLKTVPSKTRMEKMIEFCAYHVYQPSQAKPPQDGSANNA